MNFRKAFPSKYLKSADLDGDTVLTIARVGIEKVGDDEEPKLAVHFDPAPAIEGKSGAMVCNKTNAEIIAELYGEETGEWTGKRVTLYVDPTVMFGGKRTPAIRIRPAIPSSNGASAPTSTVGSNDESLRHELFDLVMEAVSGDLAEVGNYLKTLCGKEDVGDLSGIPLSAAINRIKGGWTPGSDKKKK